MPTAEPREKPLVIFDGRCGFCRIWIDYWKRLTGDRVDYAPSQEVADDFPYIPKAAFAKSVQLVLPDGEILSGARAVYELLSSGYGWRLRLYDRLPGFAAVSESAYRFIAGHRNLAYWVTVIFFGRRVRPAEFVRIEWLFLRALALIYMAAFISLGVQIEGLIGSHGILPIGQYLQAATEAVGPWTAWRAVPTIFWIAHTDGVLLWACIAGAAFSIALLLGLFQRTSLIALFILYL